MSALRVGVIGCGNIAQEVLLNLLPRMPDVELIAIAEPDPERRKTASRRAPAAVVCLDYRDLLKMPGVEAVIICVPNSLHAEIAIAAMEHGKHVYLEKPIATSPEEAQKVIDVRKRLGVVGMVGFNYRFNPLYETTRHYIRSGRLGTLVSVRSVFAASIRQLPVWKRTRSGGGGVLLDLASHHVDLIRFFFDQQIRTVFADLRSQRTEQDTAVLQLRLEDGLLVQSFFSLSAVDEDRFEIYGQAGKLTVDRYRSLDVDIVDAEGTSSRLRRVSRRLRFFRSVPYLFKRLQSPWHEPSYREALSRFVAAVRGREKASPDLLDGYRCLEVICAAEQAAQKGQSVALAPSVMDS